VVRRVTKALGRDMAGAMAKNEEERGSEDGEGGEVKE
jgi:hypothetical protein